MLIVFRQVIGDAGKSRVNVGATELLGRDCFTGGCLTSGGPPREIVPVFFTMIVSSDIAGTYAPPAVQDPMTTATWGMRSADMRA